MSYKAYNPVSEVLGLSAQRAADPKPRLPSKRKRDTTCRLGTFNKPFTIRPCPQSPYDKPHTFKPVRVITRSQLPLSFLDTASDDNFGANRLFAASIEVLEQHHDGNHHRAHEEEAKAPRVLIARYETRKTLYAVERVQAHVYSLCKLASWLKEKEVEELWDPENIQVYPTFPQRAVSHGSSEWWKHAMVDTQPAEKPTKHARLAMLRPQPSPRPAESQTISGDTQQSTIQEPHAEAIPIENQLETMESPTLPTPQEQLYNLVEQYLDALYISKMSLAYFAKGPIARIRNAFTSSQEGAPATHELVTFLRSMLLTHEAEEKKYREKLPELIQALPPGCFSDDDPIDATTKPKKTKKIKLNRDGMYPQEVEVVKRWWFGGTSAAEINREETVEQRVKRRLGDLRVREALLQMILILEIIALENLSTYKGPPEEEKPAVNESLATEESQAKPKKRKKKIDDVNLLLDLLLDKLCIWQSVEQEGVLDFDAKTFQDQGPNGPAGNDRLQSFCVEVIIPFYMNKLPEQARMVNKKLGGPVSSSPPKRKAMKPPLVSRKSGEPKEPESKKSRRSLGRFATDITGKTGHARVTPSLTRSVTDSTLLNGIKREGSEVPLSSIPFQRSPSNAARQSMSHLKLLKGREVDLSTTTAAAAKLKQRKRVEEDLKDAISALKKPNRGLVAGKYVDDVEKRGLGSTNRSRKPAKPVRKIMQDVEVSATPRVGKRTKDMVEQTPMSHHNPFARPRQSDAPPSGDFCIPSSGARPASSVVPGTIQRSAAARTLAPQGVAETPSRRPAGRKTHMSTAPSRMVFATPSKSRAKSPDSPPYGKNATPTKAIASSPPTHKNPAPTPRTLFATPLKSAATAQVTESPLPALPNAVKPADEHSIYDALGWNDDDDFI